MKAKEMRGRIFALALGCALVALADTSQAQVPGQVQNQKALFALVIGSNISVDADLQPLKYADDDAARYVDLFRLLGARTYLLTRPDENTARLHVQATAEASLPRSAELEHAVQQVAADVARARARGVETLFYFVYAGHGSVRNGEGYITLEDARITGAQLASNILGRIGADNSHVIVDACDSYLLAYPRGPGGTRRPVEGFQKATGLADDEHVGLLLSSSSSRESHEWEGFQSGVFSHEVLSGLYGAADADGDGQVSYREIAAFVARANAAIPNERFRPQVHARPPKAQQALLDLRNRMDRRLEIDGAHAGHYVVEDARGVRIAEANPAPGTTVRILRGAPNGTEYVRRIEDDKEFAVPANRAVVSISDLTPDDPRVASRGAAHEAFNLVFTLPFGNADVQAFEDPADEWSSKAAVPQKDVVHDPAVKTRGASVQTIAGWSAVGAGVVGLGLGAFFSVATANEVAAASSESQRDAAASNDRIGSDNRMAAIAYVAGAAAVTTGVVLLLWPSAPRGATVSAMPNGFTFGYGARF